MKSPVQSSSSPSRFQRNRLLRNLYYLATFLRLYPFHAPHLGSGSRPYGCRTAETRISLLSSRPVHGILIVAAGLLSRGLTPGYPTSRVCKEL
jgi:hypothetical protein